MRARGSKEDNKNIKNELGCEVKSAYLHQRFKGPRCCRLYVLVGAPRGDGIGSHVLTRDLVYPRIIHLFTERVW